MNARASEWDASITIRTNNPRLAPLVAAAEATEVGSLEHAQALAALFAAYAVETAASRGYRRGHRDGSDEGAAPYLDGPWWRRAWTAARS